MDKQFVNIDDLVRQRLSGKEERERSGAWANMEQLLDKEMPEKKRLAGFYWRWMFSTMAVLLLLVSISVGGYELLSSVRGKGQGDLPVSGSAVMKEAGSNTLVTSTQTHNNQQININNSSDIAATTESITSNINNTKLPESQIASTNSATEPSNKTIASNVNAKSTDNQSNNKINNETNIASDNAQENTSKKISSSTLDKQPNSVDSKNASEPTGFASVTAAKRHNRKNINKIQSSITSSTNDKTGQTAAGMSMSSLSTSGPVDMSTATASSNKMTGISTPANPASGKVKSGNYSSLANNKRAANILSKASKEAIANSKKTKHNTSVIELPLASSMTTSPTAGTGSTHSISVGKQHHTSSNTLSASITSSKLTTKPKASNINASKPKVTPSVALAKNETSTTASTTDGESANKDGSARDRKKIDKLVLVYRERYLKGGDDDGYFKMDTISLRAISQELAAQNGSTNKTTGSSPTTNTAGTAAVATPTAPNTKVIVSASTAAKSKKSGAFATHTTNTAEEEPTTEQPVANASVTDNVAAAGSEEESTPATGIKAKELSETKKSAGTSKTDKLVEKFNDLKVQIKGIQFAPGLIAGINSTFMSPASFKGFQFGFTGELVFNDNLSVMGELKYFNRINDNYSVEDNFYRYTPVGGQYRKELILNSYGFSTLHSVEMPVSVRYSSGKFTFFAGGNFLYTFAINTGVEGRASGNTVMTSAVGNDNTPKYSTEDFNSRFGVGYLVGASYQISPSFSLDLREVQTVWDNAGTQSSKSISSQLYKHPSLQVSVGYRFGRKPTKD